MNALAYSYIVSARNEMRIMIGTHTLPLTRLAGPTQCRGPHENHICGTVLAVAEEFSAAS